MSLLSVHVTSTKIGHATSYGERGFDIINRFILAATPILEIRTGVSHEEFEGYDSVVTKILLPEAVSVIISEDYECTIEDGYHIGWLSELYGDMEYPQDHTCPVLGAMHREESKEIREMLSQIEADIA